MVQKNGIMSIAFGGYHLFDGDFDFSKLPLGVLKDIIHGNCKLVLSLYMESYFTDKDLTQAYHLFKQILLQGVPSNKIIWTTNAVDGQKVFNDFCDRHNLEILGIKHITFIESFHLFDWQYDELNYTRKRFIYPQKVIRPHRIFLGAWMWKNGIDAYMSQQLDDTVQYQLDKGFDQFPDHGIDAQDIEDYLGVLPLSIDDTDLTKNGWECTSPQLPDRMRIAFERSGIYIIGETWFDRPGLFLSEKTFKALSNFKPFIILGQPGSLQALQDLGFKTFAPYINEKYDQMRDPSKRMSMVQEEILRLNNLSDKEFNSILFDINKICEHNFNHIKHMKHIDLGQFNVT